MSTVTTIKAEHGDYITVRESDGYVYITAGDDEGSIGVYLTLRTAQDVLHALQTAIAEAT